MESTSGPDYGFVLVNSTEAEEIAALVNSAYRGESSKLGWTTEEALLGGQRTDPEMIREMISQPNEVIWALRDLGNGQLVACAHLEKIKDRCFLGMLSVKPELQNMGLGRMMIEHGEAYADEIWHCREMAMVVISVRDELFSYYERQGYKKTGESKDFPRHDSRFGIPKRDDFNLLTMSKPL